MRVWRLARRTYTLPTADGTPANLLDGEGACRAGGRWNYAGTPVVYTSQSIALAAMEVFVHMGASYLPLDHLLIGIDIPDAVLKRAFIPHPLPDGWDAKPDSAVARNIGDRWLREGKALVMRVPSVLVREEFNYLINPVHRDITRVAATVVRDFRFDPRLFRVSK
jgi:RES domain-containing protein